MSASIAIRMYNVGFGDCFLLRLPTADGERRMLVDCGWHSQGRGAYDDKELVKQIAIDAGGSIDVVVATHRHQDHISGFGETDLWAGIGVEEVWLPFTAGPPEAGDPHGLASWNRLLESADHLVDANGALKERATQAMAAHSQAQRDEVAFLLWNARANKPGIENLTRGMRRRDGTPALRRYLPADGKDVPAAFTSEALPGARIHVLGPSRDPKYRRKTDTLPPGWGLVDDGSLGARQSMRSPFGDEWAIPQDQLPRRRPFKDESLAGIRGFNDDLLVAARAADGFLNGESLVLLIELGSARLLFTGDAEVSSWTKILETPDLLALAAGATFLKVGHHGSHNATPIAFLRDHLAARVPAMISTQQGTEPFRNGIPLEEIFETMTAKEMSHVRSDRSSAAADPFIVDSQDRWIDCSLPC